MTMGEYIKELRLAHGLSQEELGKKVKVNRAAVNKWENGTVKNLKRSTILKLSDIFNVPPSSLMCWEEDSPVTKEDLNRWEECLNPNGKLADEVVLMEKISTLYGKMTAELVGKFTQLDSIDQAKIMERTDILLESEKYSSQRTKE